VAAICCDVLVEHLLQALAPEHDDIPNCKKTSKTVVVKSLLMYSTVEELTQ